MCRWRWRREKRGRDFLQKPIDPGKLLTLVDAALRQRQSVIARRQYCQQNYRLSLLAAANGRFGIASAFSSWRNDIAVWLYGEPGTGRMTGALPAPVRTAR